MNKYTVVYIYNKLTSLDYATYFQGDLDEYNAFNTVMTQCFGSSNHKFLQEVAKIQGAYQEWEVFVNKCSTEKMARKIRDSKKNAHNCNFPDGLNNYRRTGQDELDDIENFKTAVDMAKKNNFGFWHQINKDQHSQAVASSKIKKPAPINTSNGKDYVISVFEEEDTKKCFAIKTQGKNDSEETIRNRFKNRIDNSKLGGIIPQLIPYDNFKIVYKEKFCGTPEESEERLVDALDNYNCVYPNGFNLPKGNKMSLEEILDGVLEDVINEEPVANAVENDDAEETLEPKKSIWSKVKNFFKEW